ncbi:MULTISPECIES: CaiB/BaiF CoA-transferase family protein [unclassified Cryobacterium]|uniref:CaiB/BaiF CoA transferase family protein n=1 Tax=unclassified Cryobacterium TaxID=2649013 RepID=UPI00141AF9AD|nr:MULTISPECIES: CoA transferase [unclassified Cryobacterium]
MRVLDLSQQLPGPYATQLLAALGATVVKIEPPQGDAARHLDPKMFANVNAGKVTYFLNLKEDHSKLALYSLIAGADVFVEGYRPGVTRRLGCDYVTLTKYKANIVYCSISGFGQEGPRATRPTHDISLQAIAGALPPGAQLDRIGVPWVDLATATTAALTIVAAYHRGAGGYIDSSMLDSAIAWAGIKPDAVTSLEPTYGTVVTLDGITMIIAILEDTMWMRLCQAVGWSDWKHDEALEKYSDRRRHAQTIRHRLDQTIGGLTAHELVELAITHDLPIERFDEELPDAMEQREGRSGAPGHPPHSTIPIPAAWQSRLTPFLGKPHP